MPKVTLPIAQGFYESPSIPVANQRCVNLYPVVTQSQSPFTEYLLGTPGTTLLTTTGETNQVNRGGWVMAGIPYFVNGTTLYRLNRAVDVDGNETFSATSLGTVPGTARCQFADNGTELLILAEGNGYIYDGSFAQITDTDFTTTNGTPVSVAFIDSFFIVSTDTKKIKKSAANDGTTWEPLEFASAETSPDEIVGLNVFRNQLYVFGEQTIEPFENAGLGGFPFQRITGAVLPKGLSARDAVVNTSDAFLWLGKGINETPAVWMSNGGAPQKVSTTAIDNKLAELSPEDISACFAWSYAESGAYFVGFSFPTVTYVFDSITGRWHERESQVDADGGGTEIVRWRGNSVLQAYGRILVGDSQDGRIGELSLGVYTEYDNELISFITTMPLYNQSSSISIPCLEMVCETGVGSYGSEAEIKLATSKDGRVFNDTIGRKIGELGDYDARAVWYRLGRFSRFAVFKFTISDAIKRAFLALEITIKEGVKRHG